ncbi:hypothetical protein NM688_g7517 [Phlebia brevispora]|uniref:Uncharacterized protein n=1 Tax=Phlebia brevispora TaxID=194682 RepID=A0ACC1S4H2_9APHY|nr:hypothetical protein NM688_g7517 [Phlebia brevispora]
MDLLERIYTLLTLYACISVVIAIPAFEGISSWSSIGSLVPGLSTLEAIGPRNVEVGGRNYVSIAAPWGSPGNATVKATDYPPLFYVHNGQLWYYHNVTTIWPVNVYNTSLTSRLPLQLKVGTKQEGVRGGDWRWQGTMLFYEQGSATNGGVYYSCQDSNGLNGLFLWLKPSPTPPGCTLFTVHSFSRDLL